MAITTKATTVAPAVADAGSRKHFETTADLTAAVDLEAFVKAASTIATIVELGTPAVGGMRFAIENNGRSAADMATATGETVNDFAY